MKKFPMTIKKEATEKTLHHIMLSVLERGLAGKWIAVSLLIFAADVLFIAATFQLKNFETSDALVSLKEDKTARSYELLLLIGINALKMKFLTFLSFVILIIK